MENIVIVLLIFALILEVRRQSKMHKIQNDRIEEKLDVVLKHHNIPWFSEEEKKNIKSLSTQLVADGELKAAKKLETLLN